MTKLDGAAAGAGMAIDQRSLESLKLQANQDPQGTARQAARQFEAHGLGTAIWKLATRLSRIPASVSPVSARHSLPQPSFCWVSADA